MRGYRSKQGGGSFFSVPPLIHYEGKASDVHGIFHSDTRSHRLAHIQNPKSTHILFVWWKSIQERRERLLQARSRLPYAFLMERCLPAPFRSLTRTYNASRYTSDVCNLFLFARAIAVCISSVLLNDGSSVSYLRRLSALRFSSAASCARWLRL